MHYVTSCKTEAAKLEEIRTHVDKLGGFVTKMNDVEVASPWQRQAAADVTPMVEELASDVTMTIYHLGDNPDRFVFTSFPEYVAANAELATETADTLSEYVAYREAKQKAEELSFELELPTS